MSSPVATYLYDQTSYNGLTITNGIGRRTGMTDQAGSEAWSYDTMGRIASDQRTTSGLARAFSYTYNLDGSPATVTHPKVSADNPLVVTFQPGGAGRPVSESSADATYAYNVHYASNGALCYWQQNWGAATTANRTFNNRLQPVRIYESADSSLTPPTPCTNPTQPSNLPVDFTYYYVDANGHNNGNVIEESEAGSVQSKTYTYDSLNRVATASTIATNQPQWQGENVLAVCWGEQFGYDPWGNLLSISPVSSAYTGCTQENLNVSVNTSNQINVAGFAYDSAGNLIAAPPTGTTYVYDAENHLVSAGGQTYFYDGDGKRVEKASGTPLIANKLYWYGTDSSPTIETDPAGNELFRYFRFQGLLVTREESNDWVDHYGLDTLGNVRWVYGTNSGSPYIVDWDISDYYPFGGERIVKSNSTNRYKFTSKERDSESGNDNFAARFYSSSLGRFMSPDPANAGATLDAPQSWNAYSYVLNNPINATDPTGLECVWDDGSYDDQHDPDSGSSDKCGKLGGTWLDHSFFDSHHLLDWNPNGNGDIASYAQSFQVTVTADACKEPTAPFGSNASVKQNIQTTRAALIGSTVSGNSRAAAIDWWVQQVKARGPWDYKAHYPGSNSMQHMTASAFGNFNYGATCNALQLTLSTCQRGAGAVDYKNAFVDLLSGNGWGAGPGNPFTGTPAIVNGQPDYGDQTNWAENPSVIAGYYFAQSGCGND